MSLLSCADLKITIVERTVCRALDFAINPGQRWAVLGRNGVGKTTLLLTLAGLRETDAGEIKLQEKPLAQWSGNERAKRLGFLFQHQYDAFPATVLETCLIGRHPHIAPWRWETEEDHAITRQHLRRFELESKMAQQVDTLSGGERQRLALATLLTQETDLLLLDEPTNHLDIQHQMSVLQHLEKWCEDGERATVMTLHDINLAYRFCSHALLLDGEGETIQGAVEEVLTEANLERLYQHPMMKVEGPWGQAFLPR